MIKRLLQICLLVLFFSVIVPYVQASKAKDSTFYTLHVYVDTGSSMTSAWKTDVLDITKKKLPSFILNILNGKFLGYRPLIKNSRIFVTPFCTVDGALRLDSDIEKSFSYRVGEKQQPDFTRLRKMGALAWSYDNETDCDKLINDKAWPRNNPNTIIIILSNSQKQLNIDSDFAQRLQQVGSAVLLCKLPRLNEYSGNALSDEIKEIITPEFKKAVSLIKGLKRKIEISKITPSTGFSIRSSNPTITITMDLANKTGYVIKPVLLLNCKEASITPQQIKLESLSIDQTRRVRVPIKFSQISGSTKNITLSFNIKGDAQRGITGADTDVSIAYIKDADCQPAWIAPEEVKLDSKSINFSDPVLSFPVLNVPKHLDGTFVLNVIKPKDEANMIGGITLTHGAKDFKYKITVSDSGVYTLKLRLVGDPVTWTNKTAELKLSLKSNKKGDGGKIQTKTIKIIGYTPQTIKFNSSDIKIINNGVATLPVMVALEESLRFPCKLKITPVAYLLNPKNGVIELVPGEPAPSIKFNEKKLDTINDLTITIEPVNTQAVDLQSFNSINKVKKVSLKVKYNNFKTNIKKYKLTVYGGTGSGSYVFGQTIKIRPSNVMGGSFVEWDSSYLQKNKKMANNLLTMPDKDIVVRASFDYVATEPAKSIKLKIYKGSGSGSYKIGKKVKVNAKIPNGKAFKEWQGDTKYLTKAKTEANNYLEIPKIDKKQLELTAVFADESDIAGVIIVLIVIAGIIFIIWKFRRKKMLRVSYIRNGDLLGTAEMTHSLSLLTAFGCPESIQLFMVYDKEDAEIKIQFKASAKDSQLRFMRTQQIIKLNADMKTTPERLGKYAIVGTSDVIEITEPEA